MDRMVSIVVDPFAKQSDRVQRGNPYFHRKLYLDILEMRSNEDSIRKPYQERAF